MEVEARFPAAQILLGILWVPAVALVVWASFLLGGAGLDYMGLKAGVAIALTALAGLIYEVLFLIRAARALDGQSHLPKVRTLGTLGVGYLVVAVLGFLFIIFALGAIGEIIAQP